MIYADQIMKARIFMGFGCEGEHECVSCGLSDRAGNLVSRTLKINFVNFDDLMLGTGRYICDSCKSLMDDKDMRFKAVFYERPGEKQLPERENILDILTNPPKEFVLSVPYSFKKHHWLFAGLSNPNLALIGTDDRTIALDYGRYDIKTAIETVQLLITAGVPRKEIIVGRYSTFTRYRVANVDEYDKKLQTLRPCGAVELFVRYTPAVTAKKETLGGKNDMITETEWKAAEILLSIATRSRMRRNNGIQFWGGYFERRINRLKNLELHEFVSKLSDAVGAAVVFTGTLEKLENEDAVMREIREKTNLIISLAYTIQKENKNEN